MVNYVHVFILFFIQIKTDCNSYCWWKTSKSIETKLLDLSRHLSLSKFKLYGYKKSITNIFKKNVSSVAARARHRSKSDWRWKCLIAYIQRSCFLCESPSPVDALSCHQTVARLSLLRIVVLRSGSSENLLSAMCIKATFKCIILRPALKGCSMRQQHLSQRSCLSLLSNKLVGFFLA